MDLAEWIEAGILSIPIVAAVLGAWLNHILAARREEARRDADAIPPTIHDLPLPPIHERPSVPMPVRLLASWVHREGDRLKRLTRRLSILGGLLLLGVVCTSAALNYAGSTASAVVPALLYPVWTVASSLYVRKESSPLKSMAEWLVSLGSGPTPPPPPIVVEIFVKEILSELRT